jgi:ABC-type antimicrobial peptide transport system permease subunit
VSDKGSYVNFAVRRHFSGCTASPLRIITGMLSRTFVQVGIGIVLGSIPGAALIAALVTATLGTGISFRMIVVGTACVALFIIAVAMISCIQPVRHAQKIQPIEALRTS